MKQLIEQWQKAEGYQKFELIAFLVVVAAVTIIACFAIARLLLTTIELLILKMDFLEPGTFQTLFGMIFIVLITLEFNRSIFKGKSDKSGVIQIKGVILIAIMVVIRKLIVTEIKDTPLEILLGFSILLLALGLIYFLISRASGEATD